jgi:hypothetical protein
MCHNSGKHLFSFLLILLLSPAAFAQTTESGSNPVSNKQNSPYSRYGFGDLRSGTNISLRGMGSISAAAADKFAVNTDNPASYASLLLTTYEAAGEGNSHTLRANNQSYSTGMATLSYMTIGIPMGKYAGMAIGLRPTSRTFYNVQDSAVGVNGIPGIGDALRIYYGDGSLSQAFIGFSGKVKGFSLGFNLGYMFGNIRTTSALINIDDSTTAVNTEVSRYTNIGGLFYKVGAMYESRLTSKMGLRLGVTGSLSQDLNATRNEYQIAYLSLGGITSYDTVASVNGGKGSITLPMTITGGIQLFGGDSVTTVDKWRIGIDFNQTQWGQFRNFGNSDSLQASTYKISIGGEYTPNAQNLRKYLPRVSYRLGFYFGKDYIRLRNVDMNMYAVTFGASLPFRKTPDRIHTAFEIGSRGTLAAGLIKENFVKFSLGVSLNAFKDRWFQKRRYE